LLALSAVLLSGTVVADSARRELVIVDSATPDYEALLDDLTSHSDPGRQIETVIIGSDGEFYVINAAFVQHRFFAENNGEPWSGSTPGATLQSGTFKNISGDVELINSYVEVAQDRVSESDGTLDVMDVSLPLAGTSGSVPHSSRTAETDSDFEEIAVLDHIAPLDGGLRAGPLPIPPRSSPAPGYGMDSARVLMTMPCRCKFSTTPANRSGAAGRSPRTSPVPVTTKPLPRSPPRGLFLGAATPRTPPNGKTVTMPDPLCPDGPAGAISKPSPRTPTAIGRRTVWLRLMVATTPRRGGNW
jgi:hypothetical protein